MRVAAKIVVGLLLISQSASAQARDTSSRGDKTFLTRRDLVTSGIALGASAIKVKVAGTLTTTTGGTLSYPTSGAFTALDATTPLKVAGATSGVSGGTTTVATTYSVTLPTNATLGTV